MEKVKTLQTLAYQLGMIEGELGGDINLLVRVHVDVLLCDTT